MECSPSYAPWMLWDTSRYNDLLRPWIGDMHCICFQSMANSAPLQNAVIEAVITRHVHLSIFVHSSYPKRALLSHEAVDKGDGIIIVYEHNI